MNDNQLILNELRAFFKSKKISQKEVAESIGKKQSYINYILTGKVNITRDTAQLLHDAYGFSKEFLLFGSGELFANASDEGKDAQEIGIATPTSNDALISRLIDELVEERRINQELQAKIQQLQEGK